MAIRTTVVVCLLCFAASQLAVAAEPEDLHPYLERGFSLDLGVFFPDRKLDLQVNGSIRGINREIDYDEGFKTKHTDDVFAAELAYRFRGRWSVLGQYFNSSGSTGVVLEEDIEWGNVVFGAGSFAAIGADFTLTRIFVGRQLNTSNVHDVGIGGGIHWLEMGAFVEGQILINGIPLGARRSVREGAPLPNVGVWYRYSISPRWALRTRFDLLSADLGDYSGTLINVALGLNYQVFEHFGLGLSYNYFELDVNIDKSNWQGYIETIYEGIYVNMSFYY